MTSVPPAAATKLITTHCPSVRAQTIDYLGEGDFCVAYLVDDCWVFRFAKHEQAAASLRREACLLPRIADQFDLRIPSPQFVHVDEQAAFMGYPLLPGPPLTRDAYLRLEETDRDRCVGQLARFLTQLHTTDLAVARACGVGPLQDRVYYRGVLNKAHEHLFAKLTMPDRAFVDQTIAAYIESQDPAGFQPVVLHGDFSPDHVLYDERNASLTGIIDFGDVGLGDPAWDFVFIYEDYGLDFLSRFVRDCAPADPGELLQRVFRFYVLAATEWAVRCVEQGSHELDDTIRQLGYLRTNGEQQLQELLLACGAD